MTLQRDALLRWLGAALVSAAGAYLVALQSALPFAVRDADAAHLRLSWMARPQRIETCRTLSEKELEAREEHMRQRVECEGRSATYRLHVMVDTVVVADVVVRGGGLRHDRPIHLLRDFAVTPGSSRLRVTMTRIESEQNEDVRPTGDAKTDADTGLFAGRAERERVERSRRARAAIPANLVLDAAVAFRAGRVTLVTFDGERRELQLVPAATH